MRCSDADRERVAAFLRDHAAEGRLTAEELDERVGAAYRAVTMRDLHRLVVDLPDSPFARPHRPLPQARRGRGALLPLGILAVMALPGMLWVMWWTVFALGVAALAVLFAVGLMVAPFILLVVAVVLALRRRRSRPWGPLGLR